MVARDVYRWALIKHAAANPDFRSLAFPMPHSKYIDKHDKGPERNLKSYRAARKLDSTKSPLRSEVVYTTAELEAAKPKPSRSSKTSTYYVPFDSSSSSSSSSSSTSSSVLSDASIIIMPKTPPRRTVVRENPSSRITEVTLRASSSPSSSPRREQQQQQQQQCRPSYRPPIRGVSMWFAAV
ncbi:hypothetical protein Q9L58_009753 [Maublancomyces gigas]|uniref:Uncharacterized protein n=1 Tax=Discina gigas TaxID=1032678 RepID=A0ABR3G6E9_9PEZI